MAIEADTLEGQTGLLCISIAISFTLKPKLFNVDLAAYLPARYSA